MTATYDVGEFGYNPGRVMAYLNQTLDKVLAEIDSVLATDPPGVDEIEKIYAVHIHYYRAGDLKRAVFFLHALFERVPPMDAFMTLFNKHLDDARNLQRLVQAYLQAYPNSRLPYIYALAIAFHGNRFDQATDLMARYSENADKGIHFQPALRASLFDTVSGLGRTQVEDPALAARVREILMARGGASEAPVWRPLRVGTRDVELAAAGDDGGLWFHLWQDGGDPATVRTAAGVPLGAGPVGGVRHYRATFDELSPDMLYRYAAGAGDPPDGACAQGCLRTRRERNLCAETLAAEILGPGTFAANGRIAGAVGPACYHFRYGSAPDSLDRETPDRPVPAGLEGHSRECGENLFRRLTFYSWRLTAVVAKDGPIPGEADQVQPTPVAAMRLTTPFGKDRDHMNGVGVVDLAFNWTTAAHERGDAPPAFRSERYPQPPYAGEAIDLRDARYSLTYRTDLDRKAFFVAPWIHAGTGTAATPDRSEDLAPWAMTGALDPMTLVPDGRHHRRSFEFSGLSYDWTFAGNNVEELGGWMRRYPYFPLSRSLSENRLGNLCLVFLGGDEMDTPDGDLEVYDHEFQYRSRSVLLAGQGTRLIRWPEGGTADPGMLTDGWIASAGHEWAGAAPASDGLEFVWELAGPTSLDMVRLHQHPLWPAREVAFLTSMDGKAYRAFWETELDDVPGDPADWGGLVDARGLSRVGGPSKPQRARFLKMVIRSGHRDARWGLDAVEAFSRTAAPIPDGAPVTFCEEIDPQSEGGPLFVQLVAEDDKGTVEGAVVEVTLPTDDRPRITGGRVVTRDGETAELCLRTNAMGRWSRLTVRPVTARGDSAGDVVELSIGKWAAPRHTLVRLTGLPPGEAVMAHAVVMSEAGDSAEFVLPVAPSMAAAENPANE